MKRPTKKSNPGQEPFVGVVSFDHDHEVIPDNQPGPSAFQNSPWTNNALGQPNMLGQGVISTTDEMAAISGNGTQFTPQGAINDLMEIRSKYPFLPIMPFPDSVDNLYLAAGVSQELVIPDAATLMMIRGSADYYISRKGRADTVTAANASTAQNFFAPEGCYFYVGGVKAFSVISPYDATIICAAFWFPSQYPES